jgi:hypothetical protein
VVRWNLPRCRIPDLIHNNEARSSLLSAHTDDQPLRRAMYRQDSSAQYVSFADSGVAITAAMDLH